jgi:hypothetical protein
MAKEFVNFGKYNNVKEAMDIQTEKMLLMEELDKVQDVSVIAEIRKRLREIIDDPIVGYELSGEPITRSMLMRQLEEAEQRIDRGEYITQEDLEKEAESW